MVDRKDYKTSSGVEYTIKTRLKRGEIRALEEAAFKHIDVDSIDEKGKPSNYKIDVAKLMSGQEDTVIKVIVEKINGQANVLDTYNNLYGEDALEIFDKANEIVKSLPMQKKS